MRPTREDTKPWFRQFWPWFLIALPATAVIASMITIGLAITSRDGLVVDDYYKKGLAIHKEAERTEMARQLGVTADLRYSIEGATVDVTLGDAPIDDPPILRLTLYHPTRDDQDRALVLRRSASRNYSSGLEPPLPPANWRVSLAPPGGEWRISGRIGIPTESAVALRP